MDSSTLMGDESFLKASALEAFALDSNASETSIEAEPMSQDRFKNRRPAPPKQHRQPASRTSPPATPGQRPSEPPPTPIDEVTEPVLPTLAAATQRPSAYDPNETQRVPLYDPHADAAAPLTPPYQTGPMNAVGPGQRPLQTGRMNAIPQQDVPHEPFKTGGFMSVEALTGNFDVNALRAGAPPAGESPHEHFSGKFTIPTAAVTGAIPDIDRPVDSDTRLRYGIWGGAVGAIIGIILGMLNAFFEQVPLARAQTPLIALTVLGILCFGGVSAYVPRTVGKMLRENGIIRD